MLGMKGVILGLSAIFCKGSSLRGSGQEVLFKEPMPPNTLILWDS